MAADFNPSAELNESAPITKTPNPGEIWTIAPCDPIELVMIVTVEAETVTVMPLSRDLKFLSDVDVLIPLHRSSLTQDLLAHTWQVVETPTSILVSATGGCMARSIYDRLLDIGDYYHGLSDQPPTAAELAALDLQQGPLESSDHPEIQTFHQQLQVWGESVQLSEAESDRVTPILEFTERLMQEAIELEKMISASEDQSTRPSPNLNPSQNLSQWLQVKQTAATTILQSSLTAGWQILTENLAFRHPDWAGVAYRGQEASLAQVPPTVSALESQLQAFQDPESFWATIDQLWQLEPEHPAVGVRRINLLERLPVAWVIAIVPQADKLAIRLQVYAAEGQQYVPSGLKLILQDESGQTLRKIVVGQADVCIQLKFMGVVGEAFRVRLELDDVGVTEDFLL